MTEKWFERHDVVAMFAASATLRSFEPLLKQLTHPNLFYDVLRNALERGGTLLEILTVPRKPAERRALYERTAQRVTRMLVADVGFRVAVFDHKLQAARTFRRKVHALIEAQHTDLARRRVPVRCEDDLCYTSALLEDVNGGGGGGGGAGHMNKLMVHNYNVRDLRGSDDGDYFIVFQHE
jgi:hypothetical protein